ncbi:MAG: helix-turn-helix domain-containing protein [Pleurocapsa sp.]
MVGVSNIRINESEAELEKLLQQSQKLKDKERLQVLCLFKSKQLKVKEIAQVVGKHRGTVHRWLSKYSQGGIDALLSFKYSSGRKSVLPSWALNALEKQLQQPQGFKSYRQIQQWLDASLGLEIQYATVHRLVRYQLQAKLKVPRTNNPKQDKQRFNEFKKN